VPHDEGKFVFGTEVESEERRWAKLRFALERGSGEADEVMLIGAVVCCETAKGAPERA